MLQKPTKQVCAFASESWESAESKFTSTCTGKGRKSIRSSPAREHRDMATENEMAKEIQKDTEREGTILLFLSVSVLLGPPFSLVFNAG